MINPFKDIDWKPDLAKLRQFGWSMIIGFPCLALGFFGVAWLRSGKSPAPEFFVILAGCGVAVGLLALVAPSLARPFYLLWYGFAACIGLVVSNLLLVVLYYGLFTPFALVRRRSGADPLRLRRDPNATTHWIDLPEPPSAESYFQQF